MIPDQYITIVNIIRSKHGREQLFNNYRNSRLFFFPFKSLRIMSIKRFNYCLSPILYDIINRWRRRNRELRKKDDYRGFVGGNSVEILLTHPKVTLKIWPFWDYGNNLRSLFQRFSNSITSYRDKYILLNVRHRWMRGGEGVTSVLRKNAV